MPVKAQLKYLRISPRKVRLVADLIRGREVPEALALLNFTPKRATEPLKKLLESAIANARNNFGLSESHLFISKIIVNEGPTLKRVRPRAFGRFFPILKRSSHVELVLEEIERGEAKEATKATKATEKTKGIKEIDVTKAKEDKKGELKKPRKTFEIDKFKPRIKETTRKFFRRKAF